MAKTDHAIFLVEMRQRWNGVRVRYEHSGHDYTVRRLRFEAKPTKEEREHSEKPRTVFGTIRFNASGWCTLVEDDGYEWDVDQDMLAAQPMPTGQVIPTLPATRERPSGQEDRESRQRD